MSSNQIHDLKAYFTEIAWGNESAFRSVFEHYKGRIYSLALKMTKNELEAEGVLQDVFLSLWLRKEKLIDVEDPEAYLFTITYNTVYAHLKKISRSQKLVDNLIDQLTVGQNSTEETIAQRETQNLIHKAVQQLPPRQQVIYKLSKQDDLTYEEIAERLSISKNTVRNHLAEAMKTIRSFLKGAMSFFSLFF